MVKDMRPKEAWKFTDALNKMKLTMQTGKGEMVVRWTAQPAEWKEPHLDAGGRMIGLLTRKGLLYGLLKPEFGPPTTRVYFTDYGKEGTRPPPLLLAT